MDTLKKKNTNKYLILASTDKNKEVLTKYTKIWNEIKHLIKTINGGEAGESEKDIMKIKFNSNDNFPLNITLNLYNLTIVARSVFEDDSKYYPQVFLNEC